MKKCIGLILLLQLSLFGFADSVWTGNAAVGGLSEFPGTSDVYRAASNSFPAGTILEVTNPKGGKSTRVTVIGRLDTPGVFLLIEQKAAELIGLPTDHVLPVRVSPVQAGLINPMEETVDTAVSSDTVTDDSDYNPAAGLGEAPLEVRTAIAAEPEPSEDAIERVEAAEEQSALDEILVTPVPEVLNKDSLEPDEVDDVDSLEAENDKILTELVIPPEIPESEGERETIFTYSLDDEKPEKDEEPAVVLNNDKTREIPPAEIPQEIEALPDSSVNEADIKDDDGSVVYFLTPSDLRPPPPVEPPQVEPAPVEPAAVDLRDQIIRDKDVSGSEIIITDASHAADDTEISPAKDGFSYIQIGAYKNRAVLEETARRIRSSGMNYPMSLATGNLGGMPVYKLLIGPLKPAERGVVLQSLKTSAYPDAFPYNP